MSSALPVHPLTGVRALGWRKARLSEDDGELYPIWPILGGAEDDSDDTDDTGGSGIRGDDSDTGGAAQDDDTGGDDGQDDAEPEGADRLGDAGKKALDAMKSKWRSERDKRRALEQRLAGQDGDGDDAVAKATSAALKAATARILKAEIKAAAKGKLADPRDAFKFLDLDQFEVGDDGEIDPEEIEDAVDTLIREKPYLAAQGRPRFQGTADSGAARKASRPKQLTKTDLKSMTAEQIDRAREEGRLDDLMSGR